ncbi:MAG: hypothetical protein IPM38_07930 [Ignavibacteria bacterium]|nr:hypothetical protein [Ignavibacteria bacterium]
MIIENSKSKSNQNMILTISIFIFLIVLFSQKIYSQSWSGLSTGMNDWVHALTVYNGELIVGGQFTSAGGIPANYIAKWNGSSWSPLGAGDKCRS